MTINQQDLKTMTSVLSNFDNFHSLEVEDGSHLEMYFTVWNLNFNYVRSSQVQLFLM